VKAGRLALAAGRAPTQLTIEMSDVPNRAGASVASGPSFRDESTLAQCHAVLDRFGLWPSVPPRLAARLRSGDLPPSWKAPAWPGGPERPIHILQYEEIGSNDMARAAAIASLRAADVLAIDDPSTDDWPFERAAAHLLTGLAALQRRHPSCPVAIVAGGELSVPLPPLPGIGGRNQQFALACARRIHGHSITVLSCGTDGVDGNSRAAGAIVDGSTVERAHAMGFEVHDALQRCDAFPLLEALGDAVVTGPTGTNVRDLRILVAHR
jgi:hydroxypyruvate reductase